jgi:hypothetical protein
VLPGSISGLSDNIMKAKGFLREIFKDAILHNLSVAIP